MSVDLDNCLDDAKIDKSDPNFIKSNSLSAQRLITYLQSQFKPSQNQISVQSYATQQFERNVKLLKRINALNQTKVDDTFLAYTKKINPVHIDSLYKTDTIVTLPVEQSPRYSFTSGAVNRIKPFSYDSDNKLLFTGYPISYFDWFWKDKNNTFMITAHYSDMNNIPLYSNLDDSSTKSLIQIWNLGNLELTDSKPNPRLCAIFQVDWGSISFVKWTDWEISNFLLVGCTDGFVRLFVIPENLLTTNGDPKVAWTVPDQLVTKLSAVHGMPSPRIGWATCFAVISSEQNRIAIGYSSGYIGIYSLNCSDAFNFRMGAEKESPSIRPSFLHRLCSTPVSSVAFNPVNSSMLAVCGFDAKVRIYSLTDAMSIGILNPMIEWLPFRVGGEGQLLWSHIRPDLLFLGTGEKASKVTNESYVVCALPTHPILTSRQLIPSKDAAIKSLDLSNILSTVVSSDCNGLIQIASLLVDQRCSMNKAPRYDPSIHKVLFHYSLEIDNKESLKASHEIYDKGTFRILNSVNKTSDTPPNLTLRKYFSPNLVKFNQNPRSATWFAASLRVGFIHFHCIDKEIYQPSFSRILNMPERKNLIGSLFSRSRVKLKKTRRVHQTNRLNFPVVKKNRSEEEEEEETETTEPDANSETTTEDESDIPYADSSQAEEDKETGDESTLSQIMQEEEEDEEIPAEKTFIGDDTFMSKELGSQSDSSQIDYLSIADKNDLDTTQLFFDQIYQNEYQNFPTSATPQSLSNGSSGQMCQLSPSSSISSCYASITYDLEETNTILNQTADNVKMEDSKPQNAFESSMNQGNLSKSFADLINLVAEDDSSEEESDHSKHEKEIKADEEPVNMHLRFITGPKILPENIVLFSEDDDYDETEGEEVSANTELHPQEVSSDPIEKSQDVCQTVAEQQVQESPCPVEELKIIDNPQIDLETSESKETFLNMSAKFIKQECDNRPQKAVCSFKLPTLVKPKAKAQKKTCQFKFFNRPSSISFIKTEESFTLAQTSTPKTVKDQKTTQMDESPCRNITNKVTSEQAISSHETLETDQPSSLGLNGEVDLGLKKLNQVEPLANHAHSAFSDEESPMLILKKRPQKRRIESSSSEEEVVRSKRKNPKPSLRLRESIQYQSSLSQLPSNKSPIKPIHSSIDKTPSPEVSVKATRRSSIRIRNSSSKSLEEQKDQPAPVEAAEAKSPVNIVNNSSELDLRRHGSRSKSSEKNLPVPEEPLKANPPPIHSPLKEFSGENILNKSADMDLRRLRSRDSRSKSGEKKLNKSLSTDHELTGDSSKSQCLLEMGLHQEVHKENTPDKINIKLPSEDITPHREFKREHFECELSKTVPSSLVDAASPKVNFKKYSQNMNEFTVSSEDSDEGTMTVITRRTRL